LKKRKRQVERRHSVFNASGGGLEDNPQSTILLHQPIIDSSPVPRPINSESVQLESHPRRDVEENQTPHEKRAPTLTQNLLEVMDSSKTAWKKLPDLDTISNSFAPVSNTPLSQSSNPSISARIRHLQSVGDFLFCLGQRDASYTPLYQALLQTIQSKESEEREIVAIAACLRSAMNETQLVAIIETKPTLRQIYEYVTTGDSTLRPSQEDFSIQCFLRIQLLYETCCRIGVKAPLTAKNLLNNTFAFAAAFSWSFHLLNIQPQVNLLMWDAITLQNAAIQFEPLMSSIGLENPTLTFLKTSAGHSLWLKCLQWCEAALKIKLVERCMAIAEVSESNSWIYEISMFCFLWKGWKLKESSVNPSVFSASGISAPHLFRAIARIVVERASSYGPPTLLALRFKPYLRHAIRFLALLKVDEVAHRVFNELRAMVRGHEQEKWGSPQMLKVLLKFVGKEMNTL
jgi:hypothetical protein